MKKPIVTPNCLTIFRLIITAVLLYLMLQPSFLMRVIAGFLFVIAVVTDFLDGYIARKYSLVSNFGKIADPIADKFLIIGMYVVFYLLNLFPFYWLLPIIIREVLVTVLRLIMLSKGKVSAAESAGKLKVGFQVASLVLAWLFLMSAEYSRTAIFLEQLFFLLNVALILAVVVTVYSGILFLVKNNKAIAEIGIARFVSSFSYFGFAPIMPGTVGSVGGVFLYLCVFQNSIVYGVIFVFIFLLGVWSSRRVSELLNDEDPPEVVIDEVAGILLCFVNVYPSWQILVLGFGLFRFFDILKPWPIKQLEKIKFGYGIMLDDLLAGVFANVVLQIVYFRFFAL